MTVEPHRLKVGELAFTVVSLDVAVRELVGLGVAEKSDGAAIHFANAYNVALASQDDEYATLMNQGQMVFSDGTPVSWAGKWLYGSQAADWERVYGPDVMVAVLEATNASEIPARHYFLGGTLECLNALIERIQVRWPAVKIAGFESPPFRKATPEELADRDARILDSGASFVWVGLGTPKQDYEVRRLADSIPVTAIAVGAAFDFLAGNVKQAPVWMQKSGLEWAFRFSQEPRRLAKRYLWGNPVFVREVVRQRLGRR